MAEADCVEPRMELLFCYILTMAPSSGTLEPGIGGEREPKMSRPPSMLTPAGLIGT